MVQRALERSEGTGGGASTDDEDAHLSRGRQRLELSFVQENANAKPLNKAMMAWFFEKAISTPEGKDAPQLDVIGHAKLGGLPATTIVTAEIDPLRSDGERLATKLRDNGVRVDQRTTQGQLTSSSAWLLR